MKIILKKIMVSDLVDGYEDKAENGVVGYGGKLNIRPAYQREFIYKEKQRNEVIKTVRRDFPLNTMYWAVSGDGYELMDGQQRTISICRYVKGDFALEFDGLPMFFSNLTSEKQRQILSYELSIYVCDGADGEKLDWFKIINIAGERLTDQELRNAIYTGSWLSDAKKWFSRSGCPAYQIGDKYLNGATLRQEILETALDWISNGNIENYMSSHQHDVDAQELWQYYQEVVSWIQRIFPNYRKIMKGLDWGRFYNSYKSNSYNASILEKRIVELIEDDDVNNKKGIYEYLLSGSEKSLSLRAFDEKTRTKVYELQKGVCPTCSKFFNIDDMEADHILPWSKGGKTVSENCQMLCKMDNRTKSGR